MNVYKGFSLIELVVTLAILAILACMVVPTVQIYQKRMKEVELKQSLRDIRGAIDAYKKAGDEGRIERTVRTSGYPKTLEILVQGVPDLKDPKNKKIYFLRRIPFDPMSKSTTWGLRSYESEASIPKYIDDVYDVYSMSDQIGLNGRPYKDW